MSAGVDQRNKGQTVQVANGAKQEVVKDGFDSYLQAPHQPGVYNSAPMSSPNVSEHYVPPSYYPSVSFPYLSQGLSEGPWSNGGDHMSFLGGYGQISNDYNSGMFSGFGYSQPGFGWDFTGGEYSSWGTSPPAQQQGKRTDARGYGEEYYHPESLQPMDAYAPPMNGELERGDGLRTIDQGLKGVNISDGRDMEQVSVKENMNPIPSDQVAQNSNSSGVPSKKMTWASIASQPAKPQAPMKPKSIPRAPVLPSKHNMDIGTWDMKNNVSNKQGMGQPRQAWSGGARRGNPGPYASGPNMNRGNDSSGSSSGNASARNSERSGSPPVSAAAQAVLDKLKGANHYNPKEFNVNLKSARFFIIKSYSEDDIHRSIKYSIWCSTEHGNKRLEEAFRERESKGPIYLLFSVNGSGHFCGMAQMMTNLDPHKDSNVWAQSKWKGQFEVKWIYVKDVPNSQLRHIRLENNENKPVTNSRDTQEVPFEKGKQVLKIMHNYRNTTSIFDDFVHYEKRQEEDSRDVVSDRRDAPPSREGRESRKPEPTSPAPPSRDNGRRERNGGGRERSGR